MGNCHDVKREALRRTMKNVSIDGQGLAAANLVAIVSTSVQYTLMIMGSWLVEANMNISLLSFLAATFSISPKKNVANSNSQRQKQRRKQPMLPESKRPCP